MKYLLGLHAEPITDRIDSRICGVGMIRSEYLCRSIEEYFPLESCQNHISGYVRNVCDVFSGSEVWYRTSELIVPEVNVLRGADHILDEKHYILGLRGVRRGLKYPDTFQIELNIIAKIAEERNNLNILFPFIKDSDELKECIQLLNKAKFKNQFGVMAEIPSVIINVDEFIDLGIANITVGVNDLTTFVLGTYRGSGYHDCTHKAVISLIEQLVKKAKDNNVKVNVAGNVNKKLCHICEQIGVDGFVINYPLLPEVLEVPEDELPYINLLKEIKQLTKSRREQY